MTVWFAPLASYFALFGGRHVEGAIPYVGWILAPVTSPSSEGDTLKGANAGRRLDPGALLRPLRRATR